MSEVHVEVRNAAGDSVGSFSDSAGFRKWCARMQKQLGGRGKIGAAIADALILDAPSQVDALPPGNYEAVLLRKTPIPRASRRELSDCDLWKAH